MSMQGLKLAIIGATGAVGRDLVELLTQQGAEPQDLLLFASPASVGKRVELGDGGKRVLAMPADPEGSELFDDIEVVFFACPSEVTRAVAPVLAERGLAVVDVGGALAGQAPLAVAHHAEHGFDPFVEQRLIATPSAAAVAMTHLLAPLQELGLVGCRGTVLLPASTAGQAGSEELSGQVVSLFNSQDPPRRVFPQGLAFDVLTQLGTGTGWVPAEARLHAELAALVSVAPEHLGLTTMVAPWFGGMVLSVFIELTWVPELEVLHEAWAAAPGVRVGDPVPGPRRVVGTPELLVGRVRADPAANGIHVVATADNLRMGASVAAVSLVARLREDERL